MASKTKLEVVTAAGTFTRTTARTYTHIVVAQDYSEAYKAHLRTLPRPGGYYTTEKVEAMITEAAATAGALAWSGSLSLARKVVTGRIGRLYASPRIFEVATGAEVR